ncbi:transposase [Shinella sp. SUS2]|nr:transposase [Shinella sp. SUS2]KOC72607.1 transposase [Shinella sp. GWS1]
MWPTVWRAASTIRAARVIKIAARVVEMKTQIRLHLPTSCPDQRILRIVLDRIPRLAT